MRALIVDDEKNILAALTRSLHKLNLNLTTTISAFNARKLLETTNFDLLICDQHMPEMSGRQLCQYAAQLQPSCKRIILSAYSDFTDVTEAFNRGDIHQYLTKPWDNFKLLAPRSTASSSKLSVSLNLVVLVAVVVVVGE